MRTVLLLVAVALAPAAASAGPPRATWWIAQMPPKPPKPPMPKPPKPPDQPRRVIMVKGGPHSWTVPTRKRAFLGVQLLELTNELRSHFGVGEGVGILVAKVEKETPAAAAGVQVGDVLVAIDDTAVGSARQVVRAIRTKKNGDPVKLEVMRKGKSRILKATLAERETPQIDLSGLFQFHPGKGEWRLEVEGEDIEIPLPPMPKVEELRERYQEMLEKDEVFKHYQREKNLEKRLRELEKKLRELEHKLQGEATSTKNARDA